MNVDFEVLIHPQFYDIVAACPFVGLPFCISVSSSVSPLSMFSVR